MHTGLLHVGDRRLCRGPPTPALPRQRIALIVRNLVLVLFRGRVLEQLGELRNQIRVDLVLDRGGCSLRLRRNTCQCGLRTNEPGLLERLLLVVLFVRGRFLVILAWNEKLVICDWNG